MGKYRQLTALLLNWSTVHTRGINGVNEARKSRRTTTNTANYYFVVGSQLPNPMKGKRKLFEALCCISLLCR